MKIPNKTNAICPRCGKRHISAPKYDKRSYPWVGRGIPRLHCSSCLIDISRPDGLSDRGGHKRKAADQKTTRYATGSVDGIPSDVE